MTTSFRLYESAWVEVEGAAQPLQVHRSPENPGVFAVGSGLYDIDARALPPGDAPRILSILSLQAVREAGLRSNYGRDEASEPLQRR